MNNEIKTSAQLKEYLSKGISGDIYKKFGIWSCDFYPFKEMGLTYDEEIFYKKVKESESDELLLNREVAERLIKERISTVFNNIEFYFETREQLKAFCDIAENTHELKE